MENSENLKPALDEFNQPIKHIKPALDAWRRFRRNKMALISLFVVIVYVIISVSASILPIYSYKQQVLDHQYLPPSLTKTGGELYYEKKLTFFTALAKSQKRELSEAEQKELAFIREDTQTNPLHKRRYWLGTDDLGRDLLSRIIFGSQISIAIGLIGAFISITLGTIIGAVSGYVGGKLDNMIMRFVDIMYGLPYMLIVIILMALFGRNIINLFVALGMVSWLTVARVIRGQIISLKHSEFVEAARSVGASNRRIIFHHLVPNTIGIIIVFTALRIPGFIMMEAFLSFLGLGVSAPYASWGSLIGDGVAGMEIYAWRLIFPAFAMILFLFAMNFISDGLRDALDPQSRNKI